MKRKLRSEGTAPDENVVSPVKSVRMGFARAADHAFGLALKVSAIRQSRLDLAEVADILSDDWALYPLLHDDGAVGVIGLDPSMIVALVEQQTLGRLISGEAPSRTLTRTDKALALPLLSEFLTRFSSALIDAPTAYWTCGYRTEDAVQTRHLMALQLDAHEYRGFDISLECLENGKGCRAVMYLPIKDIAPKAPAQKNAKTKSGEEPRRDPSPTLRQAALPAQIKLNAVMGKLTMPLGELRALEPGKLIALPMDAVGQARLEDLKGGTSIPVKLGQLNGMRAVRVQGIAAGPQQDQTALNGATSVDSSARIAPGNGPHPAPDVILPPAEPAVPENEYPAQDGPAPDEMPTDIDELDALLAQPEPAA